MEYNNPKPSTPAPQSSNDTPLSDSSPPKYVPQFSAATEMILKRINSGSGPHAPGYEDVKRNLLMGMKTSMNMEIPTLPQTTGRRAQRDPRSVGSATSTALPHKAGTPGSGAQKSGTPSSAGQRKKTPAKTGRKRKRHQEESDEDTGSESEVMSKLGGDSESDGSGSITDFPKVTQSGRAVVKPTQFVPEIKESHRPKRGPSKKAQEQALCKRCGRGHSPESNMIVFCDGCNGGWHQMCHDPVVSDEVVKDENASWFCADCTQKRARKSTSSEQSQRGVSWQGRSMDDKRAYFTSLPQQQLVSLLLQACVLYPNIPIFPPAPNRETSGHVTPTVSRPSSSQLSHSSNNQKKTAHPHQPFPPSATAGLFARTEANPNAPIAFIRKIAPGKNAAKNPATPPAQNAGFIHSSSAPPQLQVQGIVVDVDDDSRESTPNSPPYPKAGNGLMAKLGPDEDDLEWLVDDSDFQAFSHTLYEDLNHGSYHAQL